MKNLMLVSVSVLALTGTALAADMSAPYAKAPMMMPAVAPWAGWYLGIQGGLAQNYSNFNDLDRFWDGGSHNISKTGGIFGGNIGYNWQDRSFVWGLETDINWVGAKASETWGSGFAGNNFISQSSDINWMGSFRGRFGLDFESLLPGP